MDLTLAVLQNQSLSIEQWAAVHENVNGTYLAEYILLEFMI